MSTLISCEALSVSYDGMTVLTNLSFSVKEGEYLCIVGENGSGKSTLIKCLLGIKNADSGKIVMGEGLKQTDIGYLPQQTLLQRGFPATVGEVVLSGCLNHRGFRPFYSANEKQLADDNMKKLGILNLKSRSYRELSGGQQQRVLLARALCSAKKLILLDEPVTALDPVASLEFYELISELNSKYNITVIMVSHDIQNSMKNASHILHLNSKGYFFGSAKEYSASDISNSFIGE